MKFTISRTELLRSLNHVHSVVERRNTIPILANVLLRAEKDSLALTTTDMDLEIVESVSATVIAEGSTTVPAQTLYDIVRKLPDDAVIDISTTAGDASMQVKSGKSTFRLGCLPTEDFPKLGAQDSFPYSFTLPAGDLRLVIDRTRFAISNEETRYYLNGIYLHAATNNGVEVLRAVATDGHRLALFEMPLPEGAKAMPGVIIPRKAINEIRKLIDEAGDAITLNLSDTKIKFSFDHIVLTTKLIDGTYPEYDRVIPKHNDKILEINPALLAKAVDRVSTISNAKSRGIKLTMGGKVLTLSANSAESGSASEELEISFDSDPMEIGFNSAYLMDVTRQIDSEGCRISLSDSAGPTIIQDVSDTSSLYVLMPMRV
jgi:DNA polymerase-3 subunit beta